jgi:L-iditol 2-dehydrogenase
MCEPLSVGVHACRRAGVAPGKKVAIMGAGPIGLVTLLAAQAFGADVVAITDLQQKNLDLAAEICPGVLTHVVPSGEEPENTAMALKNAAREATRDDTLGGFEIVIDCAGFEPTVRTALAVAGPGGRVVMVGLGQASCSSFFRGICCVSNVRFCSSQFLSVSFSLLPRPPKSIKATT